MTLLANPRSQGQDGQPRCAVDGHLAEDESVSDDYSPAGGSEWILGWAGHSGLHPWAPTTADSTGTAP